MIQCEIKRKDGSISYVKISGHSSYEDIGIDIVCAAVSVLSVSAVNGLTEFVQIEVPYEINEDGFLEFQIPDILDEKKMLQTNAILETLYMGLKSIEIEYSEYIRVQG